MPPWTVYVCGGFLFASRMLIKLIGGVTMSIREEKVTLVNEIAEKLERSVSTIVTDYRGLTV
jgi:Ni,Fe-hydrogenase III large subunit